MSITIKPEGPRSARIALVAEKPAASEVQSGRLMVGAAGAAIRRHLRIAGLDAGTVASTREAGSPSRDVWLTNTVQTVDAVGNPTGHDIRQEQVRLIRELGSLPNLQCVIAMGIPALLSLSNWHYGMPPRNLANVRGSVLSTVIPDLKMVPTFHTASYMRGSWEMRPIVQFDINRALKESAYREIRRPERTYHIRPTFEEAMKWVIYLKSAKDAVVFDHGPMLMFDVETHRNKATGQQWLSCIAFSCRPAEAFCIPFCYGNRKDYWTVPQEVAIRRAISELLNDSTKTYGTQNGCTADCWWMRQEGFVAPYMARGFDTILAHRLIAPDLPHSLQFLCSIYTSEPYYKDESGFHDESTIPVSDEQFWIYNCKDAAIQCEVAIGEREDLRELGMLDFFYREVQSNWDAAFAMTEQGFRVSRETLAQEIANINSGLVILRAGVEREMGWLPNVRSPIDMEKVLTRYAIRFDRTPTGRPRISEDDLLGYANRHPDFRVAAMGIIGIKKRETLLSNFTDMALDPDDHYHPVYDPCHTKTMRFSTRGDSRGGPQIQNIPNQLRNVYVSD